MKCITHFSYLNILAGNSTSKMNALSAIFFVLSAAAAIQVSLAAGWTREECGLRCPCFIPATKKCERNTLLSVFMAHCLNCAEMLIITNIYLFFQNATSEEMRFRPNAVSNESGSRHFGKYMYFFH